MYFIRKGTMHNIFQHLFVKCLDIHNHVTRYNNNYVLPYCRTVLRQKAIVYMGANGVNYLTSKMNNIFESSFLAVFERNIRNRLLDNKVDMS